MRRNGTVPIPPPAPYPFEGGIDHPDLLLWDAWSYRRAAEVTLFCLALSRTNAQGQPITPARKNDYPFHIRRFRSSDGGRSWSDRGVYLSPGEAGGDPRWSNLWSGSALLHKERLLFGLTGVRRGGPGRPFLQTICAIETGAEGRPALGEAQLLSDPERDYDEIGAAGYYLGPRDKLGDAIGEEGGPILAWRDPFFIAEEEDHYRAFWAAKTAPDAPAIAHARVERRDGRLALTALLPPIVPPDAHHYTQAEVPKIYRDPRSGACLMLISTCDRLREDQPDSEVHKELRLYKAPGLDGPWTPYAEKGAVLPDVDHLFGGDFISVDFDHGTADLIAPYTELCDSEKQLTFAPLRTVKIGARSNILRAGGFFKGSISAR